MFQNAYFNMAMIYKMSGELEEEAEVLQDIIDLFGSEDRQGSYAKNRLAELITSTSQSSMTSDIWDKKFQPLVSQCRRSFMSGARTIEGSDCPALRRR